MSAETRFLTDLAAIRPGVAAKALRTIIGSLWREPLPHEEGKVSCIARSHGFAAQIDVDDIVRRVEFGSVWADPPFPSDIDVGGLRYGMSIEQACRVQPGLTIHRFAHPMPTGGSVKLDGQTRLRLQFLFDELRVIEFLDDDAVYPARVEPPVSPHGFPLPTRAYDLEMQKGPALRGSADCHGWAFGLPPGITARQWPLDPNTGYPLMHGFTLLLPEDYRCHGPDIVALSFFAPPAEQDEAEINADLRPAVLGEGDMPADPDLLAFWQTARGCHPRLHRMQDALDNEYAVVLLTGAEFNGPLCRPPRQSVNRWLAYSQPPNWLEDGSGLTHFKFSMVRGRATEEQMYFRIFGEIPAGQLDWHRAIRWSSRAEDPNAGIAPEQDYGRGTKSYLIPYYWEDGVTKLENYREHSWTKEHKLDHIGGTMQPIQNTPKFSPFYIEFREYFGGYNFGTGNAQLDFLNMKIDWAC